MLFDKSRIANLALANRLVMPPLETNFANEDGSFSRRTIDYYTRRAQGGPGLIVVEATSVDPVHFHATSSISATTDSSRAFPSLPTPSSSIVSRSPSRFSTRGGS